MDYREDYERGRRYRDERDFRRSDRRDWDRRDDDRGFLERLGDELRSWFRDEEARRRPREDRGPVAERWGGGARGWGAGREDDADRETGDRYYEPRSGWGDPSAWGAETAPWDRRRSTESTGGGPHAGRGPRGYQRSDERIREDVCDVLCDHGYVDASEIEVTVQSGEVTLTGIVRERAQKRMAEDAVERVAGVRDVHNQLRVSPGGTDQEPPARPGDPRFRVA